MTIQDAVNGAAFGGDTILMQPGTYTGAGNYNVVINVRRIVIMSAAGAASTIIDCGAAGRAFDLTNVPAGTTAIVGLTIRNAKVGGTSHGGAIQVAGAYASSAILIKDSVFEGNTGGYGGAVELRSIQPTIDGNHFASNVTEAVGGGLSVLTCSSVKIQNNEFINNTSENYGYNPDYVAGRGGAVYVVNSQGTIAGNQFSGNKGAWQGGGMYCVGSTLTVQQNTFETNRSPGNGAMEGYGGAIWIDGGSVSIKKCLFVSNTALNGGGAIWVGPGTHTITTSTFVDNGDTGAFEGGAAVLIDNGTPTIQSSIFALNRSHDPTNAIECRGTSAPDVSCCDFYGNIPDDDIGLCGSAIADTIHADPLFCDAATGDYSIDAASPCAADNNACGTLMGALGPACGLTPVLFQSIDAEALVSGVRIRWALFADEGVVEQRVYRAAGSGDTALLLAHLQDVTLREFVDVDVSPGTDYAYTVAAVKSDGTQVMSLPVRVRIPAATLALYQNRPNPFTSSTTVRFVLDEEREVDLAVFDVSGKRVATLATGLLPPGEHVYEWADVKATGHVSSGIYFCRLKAGGRVLSRKMLFVR